MKVFTYGFWAGFLEKTDPVHIDFFLQLLSKVFDEECTVGTPENSDILLESVFSSNTFLMYKKWKCTFFFSGESNQRIGIFCSNERLATLSMYNCILCGERNHKNIVNVPLFIPYIHCNNFIESLENPTPIKNMPEKDICVIVSNAGATDRNKFFDRLDEHFKVDYAGNYKNNVPRISASYNKKEFRDFVSQYKFIVSMDNSKDDTYLTEKITHGFLSGNIPVYWGSDFAVDYFNPDRFINVENMEDDTINRAIEDLKMLMNNPDMYMNKVNSPPLLKNKLSRTLDDIVKDVKNTIFNKKYPLIKQTYAITSKAFEEDRYNHIMNVFINVLGMSSQNLSLHCPSYKTTINRDFLHLCRFKSSPSGGDSSDTQSKLTLPRDDSQKMRECPMDTVELEKINSILESTRRTAEISLFYNQVSVLKDIRKNYKYGYFLICESDVIPTENITYFNELLTMLDGNAGKWDIINIGTPYTYMIFNDYFIEDFTRESDKFRMIRKRVTRCADSFIFSYEGVIKLLNLIETDIDYSLPYDHYMNYILEKYPNNIKMYWSIPSFFDQGSFNGMKTKIN